MVCDCEIVAAKECGPALFAFFHNLTLRIIRRLSLVLIKAVWANHIAIICLTLWRPTRRSRFALWFFQARLPKFFWSVVSTHIISHSSDITVRGLAIKHEMLVSLNRMFTKLVFKLDTSPSPATQFSQPGLSWLAARRTDF